MCNMISKQPPPSQKRQRKLVEEVDWTGLWIINSLGLLTSKKHCENVRESTHGLIYSS